MCGIVGCWDRNGGPVDEKLLKRMTAALDHRGPEGSGNFFKPGLGLGHTRLKILDVTDAAKQPYTDGHDVLVFNGEIFNHSALRDELSAFYEFQSRSDTEVLFRGLQRWGADTFNKIDGQFSLAFYSAKDNRLILARDHVGICPLYVADDGVRLFFSSEIRPLLLAKPFKLNQQAAIDYFAYRYNIQNGRTLFDGIERFPPAHYWSIDLSRQDIAKTPYWRLSFNKTKISQTDAGREFSALLDQQVAGQSEADVDMGIFLSGGIDSTAVFNSHAKCMDDLRAFTLKFTEHDQDLHEVKALEERYGFKTHIVDFPRDLDASVTSALRAIEEPFADLVICANKALASSASKQVKVALTGEGGDEAFIGYDHQRGFQKMISLCQLPLGKLAAQSALAFLPAKLVGMMQDYPGNFTRLETAKIQSILSAMENKGTAYLNMVSLFESADLQELLSSSFIKDNGYSPDMDPILDIFDEQENPVDAAMRVEIEQLTLILNLLKQDRLSMAHSLETRVPLVSRPILEFAASLPYEILLSKDVKPLLRNASKISDAKKRAFSLFGSDDYIQPLIRLMDTHVTRDAVENTGVLDWSGIKRIRENLSSGSIIAVKRAMSVTMFQMWWNIYSDEFA